MQLPWCRMTIQFRLAFAALAVFLLVALTGITAAAAPAPDYTTTYTITINEDGSALWQVEYRTFLESDADSAAFDAYKRDLESVYLPQVRDLMKGSATQASVAAGRSMTIGDVTGSAAVQVSPTGKFGVIIYSFEWDGFARSGGNTLMVGDAFAGGLYLAKDSTLNIRYHDGYSVQSVDPSADQQRDCLTWYGQRSFAAGEPRVVLTKTGLPILPIVGGIVLVLVSATVVAMLIVRRKQAVVTGHDDPDEPPATLSPEEKRNVEEQIIAFLLRSGGEQFQSEIVRALELPRSTVSAAIGSLHKKGTIQKVRKGRENLIRLVKI